MAPMTRIRMIAELEVGVGVELVVVLACQESGIVQLLMLQFAKSIVVPRIVGITVPEITPVGVGMGKSVLTSFLLVGKTNTPTPTRIAMHIPVHSYSLRD